MLDRLGLTDAQRALRDGKLTASFLPFLMSGNRPKITSKWLELLSDPGFVPEDFSHDWLVQCGSYMEPLIREWHARRTGSALTRVGEVVTHPTKPWFACTLDCWRARDNTVLDIKVVGHWRKLDEVLAWYTPQMIGQLRCVGATSAALLICHGGAEPEEYPVEWDPEYERQVWGRAEAFWRCVETLVPPYEMPPLLAPVVPEKVYDMTGSNSWASYADSWLTTRDAANVCREAEAGLKELTPADAVRAEGHGVVVKQDKAGRKSLRKGEDQQ